MKNHCTTEARRTQRREALYGGRLWGLGVSVAICFFQVCVAQSATLPLMQSSFAGGELSPLAAARVDSERYYTSAACVENLVPIPQGPLVRRPGTRFVAATDANQPGRLVRFQFSRDDVYTLEFTPDTMRVMRSHGLVTQDDGTIYTLATPFDANEIDQLQTLQNADTMYLVDGSDWPQKLVRTDHNDWSLTDLAIDDGPFLSENLTDTTLAASATTGTDVNLVASTPLFSAGHVGSLWQMRDLVKIQSTSGTMTHVDANSVVIPCQAGNNFQWSIKGSWVGTVELQMSYDGGTTWTAYTMLTSTASASTDEAVLDNDSGRDVLLRIWCTEYTSGTISYSLWAHAYMHVGVVRVTGYVDPCHVTCDVVRDLAATDPTVRWSEGAWSGLRGYPRAVASYNDRLVLASTTSKPLTIWFSATGEYETFDPGAGDDADAFGYLLGRAEQDPILWLQGQRARGLLIGTSGSLFEVQPYDGSDGITPSNPPTIVQTLGVPCSDNPPAVADNILLVLQRNGRKLREVLYSYDADSLVAPDLTLFSEHVTTGGIRRMDWMGEPYTILWAARDDGQLVSLTYDRNFSVCAWARHQLGGDGAVEDVCVVPASGVDEVWLIVRRTVDGRVVRYIEYLPAWDFGDDLEDAYYVDCGLTYEGPDATTFSGLEHLEGLSVVALADGSTVSARTVAGGAVSLDHPAGVVHLGLPYVSTLTTVRYDVAGDQGVTWHRQKAVRAITLSVADTFGLVAGVDPNALGAFTWPGAGEGLLTAGPSPLYTGDLSIRPAATPGTDAARVTVVQSLPLPATIRALVALVEVP